MAWQDAAARIGTSRLISGLEALKGTMKKRDFKRLVAATAAQVLAVHPDVKPRKARRWARKATGTRVAKNAWVVKARASLTEAAKAGGTVAVTSGAGKDPVKLTNRSAMRRRMRAIRAGEGKSGSAGEPAGE